MEPARDDAWPLVLDEVTEALTSLNAALDTEADFAALLDQVCRQVTAAVPGVDEATITLLSDGKPATIAGTSDVVVQLDHGQYARDQGPCLEAARDGEPRRLSAAETTTRWPDFARDLTGAGFGSVLSTPFVIDHEHAGGINCYSGHRDGFAELDQKLLDLYTTAATPALRIYCSYQHSRRVSADLRTALNSRAVIDQAKGILMAIRRISADEAFALLAKQSQQENVKLRDLAVRFVAEATGNPPS